jgi:Zn-dependent M32 family carboxypeptidase
MLDEVNNEDSDDFDDDKNAPEVTDEQHALLASFESACRDPAGQHLMATKRQALSKRRATAQRTTYEIAHKGNRAMAAAWGIDEDDDDLMQRAVVAVVRKQHRREAHEAATFHDAHAEALAKATHVWAEVKEAEDAAAHALGERPGGRLGVPHGVGGALGGARE